MIAPPHASAFLILSFGILTAVLGLGIVGLVHLAGYRLQEPSAVTARWTLATGTVFAAWVAGTWLIASRGIIADFDRRPPPLAVMLLVVFACSAVLAFSRFGTRLMEGVPLWLLVLAQSFRLPLEWMMHRAAEDGVMPTQMSYAGWNFDVLTGLTALPVAWMLYRNESRAVAFAWNLVGSLLLTNILVIAILSTPMFAAFGPDRLNTWVAFPPFIWLPTVMVVWALTGHLLIWRRLLGRTQSPPP